MPYVQATKSGRWAVNFKGQDVESGDVVRFQRQADAEFVVNRGLGKFVTESEAAVKSNIGNKASFPAMETSAPAPKKKAPKKAAAPVDTGAE